MAKSGSDVQKRRLAIGSEELTVTPLGAGCEVGRSCILVEFKNRSIMFDCGIHPAHSGIGALPIFDAVSVEEIDLCLITHFHLDHCGALPYFVAKTPFKGRVIMTEPTRAISKLLWTDYAAMAKLSSAMTGREFSAAAEYSGSDSGGGTVTLFDQSDIDKTLLVIETVDFRQTIDFKELGISVTAYAAGHVLGACMFCVEIAGVNILYTGDYSREVDRHVPVAEIPNLSVHVLICESTYGIRIHEPRAQREKRFLDSVTKIVKRKGKCLLPVFALGRAQELLLMLEEHWTSHRELQSIPIWYASPMSSRSMIVFETFISLCGDYVQRIANSGMNPFFFKFVKTARRFEDMNEDIHSDAGKINDISMFWYPVPCVYSLLNSGPCVVMAAPGMLQSGTSRALFDIWYQDKKNGVILTGYSLRGTLADELKKSPHTLQLSRDGPSVKIESSFEMISFSAHSDFDQSFEFIQALQCPNVVLVHGERSEVVRLSDKLKELCPSLAVFCPEVLQKVTLSFPSKRQATCLGRLADAIENNEPGTPHNALLVVSSDVTTDPMPLLVSPADAAEAADLPCNSLKQTITCEYPHDTLQPLVSRLCRIFERLKLADYKLQVENRVDVYILGQPGQHYIRLEWESDPLSNLIADTISFAAVDVANPAAALLGTTDVTIKPSELETSTKHIDWNITSKGDNMSDGPLKTEGVSIREEPTTDHSDSDILEVILTALNGMYEQVEVYNQSSGKNPDSQDIMISFFISNTTQKALEHVIINFTERQVFGCSEELCGRVREFLRRLESPLLPLPPFELVFSSD